MRKELSSILAQKELAPYQAIGNSSYKAIIIDLLRYSGDINTKNTSSKTLLYYIACVGV